MLATLATGCGLVLHSAPLARPHALVHRADAARMIDIVPLNSQVLVDVQARVLRCPHSCKNTNSLLCDAILPLHCRAPPRIA